MTKLISDLDRLAARLSSLLGACAIALLCALFVLNLALVVTRDFFRIGILWIPELSQYMVIWLTYLAAPVALWRGEHFFMDSLQTSLAGNARRAFVLAADLIGALFLTLWLIAGVQHLRAPNQYGLLITWLPLNFVDAVLPIGVALMLFMQIVLTVKRFSEPAKAAMDVQT